MELPPEQMDLIQGILTLDLNELRYKYIDEVIMKNQLQNKDKSNKIFNMDLTYDEVMSLIESTYALFESYKHITPIADKYLSVSNKLCRISGIEIPKDLTEIEEKNKRGLSEVTRIQQCLQCIFYNYEICAKTKETCDKLLKKPICTKEFKNWRGVLCNLFNILKKIIEEIESWDYNVDNYKCMQHYNFLNSKVQLIRNILEMTKAIE